MSVDPRQPVFVERSRPASPCVGTCAIDEASGLCVSCARTRDEIAAWGGADEAFRRRVWAALASRAAASGLAARRLSWRGAELLDEVERRFSDASGVFVVGVYGAVAEVLREPGEAYEARRRGLSLTLRTRRAALRVEAPDYLTAFEMTRPSGPPLVALAAPAGRVGPPGPSAEVDAAIPPPDGASPEGPYTHLLPGLVAQGFDAPPTLALPKGYVLSALFHPA
ncbi:DUF1289 domain-containing protein [Methylocella sp.]|uniref:DUF1289 domain-containing protein n=1 Tax=Methylocella sp. TaxID=1978226 RepID=UPI003782D326